MKHNEDGPQPQPEALATPITLHAARSGQWMEAEAMRRWAIEQLESHTGPGPELVVDLSGIEHLDASALQVLLAIGAEQRTRNGMLRLIHASGGLRRWFEYAGAAGLLADGVDHGAATAMEDSQACAKF